MNIISFLCAIHLSFNIKIRSPKFDPQCFINLRFTLNEPVYHLNFEWEDLFHTNLQVILLIFSRGNLSFDELDLISQWGINLLCLIQIKFFIILRKFIFPTFDWYFKEEKFVVVIFTFLLKDNQGPFIFDQLLFPTQILIWVHWIRNPVFQNPVIIF